MIGGVTRAEILALDLVQAVITAAMLFAQQGGKHLGNQIIDVKKLKLDRRIVHRVLAAVCDGVQNVATAEL